MLLLPSWAALCLAGGGLLLMAAATLRRVGRTEAAASWMARMALALGVIGSCLIVAMDDRGPLAYPALAVAVAAVGAMLWTSATHRSGQPFYVPWVLGPAMLLALLEEAVLVPVAVGGWWFGCAEIAALWAAGLLGTEALAGRVGEARRAMNSGLGLQAVGLLLAWVGAQQWWGMQVALEPVLAARATALLGTALGVVLLSARSERTAAARARAIVVITALVVVWGCAHAWILAAGTTPSLYLWR